MNPQNNTVPSTQNQQEPSEPLQTPQAPSYDWQQVTLPPSEQGQPSQPDLSLPPQPFNTPQQFPAPVGVSQPDTISQSPVSHPQIAAVQPIYPNPTPPQSPVGNLYNDKRSPLPFILGGAGLVIVLILAGVGAYFVLTPSRTDYNDAIDTYNEVAKANNSLSVDLLTFTNPTSATSEQSLKQKHDAYQKAFAKLEGLKALRNQNVDSAYKAFVEKNITATKVTEEIIDSFDELIATNKACESVEIESLQPCIDAMKVLGDSAKNDIIKKYAQSSVSEYENFLSIYQKLQSAYAAGDGSAYSAAYSDLVTSSQTISELNSTFLTDAEKISEESNLKKEADAFKNALQSEAKKAPF